MGRALRMEWRKLRSTRLAWGLLGVSLTLSAMVGVLQLAVGNVDEGGLRVQGVVTQIRSPADYRDFISIAAAMSGFFAIVLGAMVVTAEYRHRTIVRTALAIPRRGRILAAKLIVAAVAGLVLGATTATTAALVAAAWLAAHGDPIPFGRSAAAMLMALPVATGFEAALAAAVGFLVRGQGAALAVAFGWLFIGESLLAGMAPASKRWLPFTGAGQALLSGPTDRLFAPWGGAVVLSAYLAVLAAASLLAVTRRDVR
jgi:ABC-type transport system involved in multi-copper enzyme maturation permease subunit